MAAPHPSVGDALIQITIPETEMLKFISRGKVRDLYSIRDGVDEYLLFVATDRISAFDVVLQNVSIRWLYVRVGLSADLGNYIIHSLCTYVRVSQAKASF